VINLDEDSITQAVLDRNAGCGNPRLAEIMSSLVKHLHDFAREVRLTEAEWAEGIAFLTDTGHITDEKRQEFILLSDTLGLSMLVIAMNHAKPRACTESTVFGPFFVPGAPLYENGADIANGASGAPCFVRGTVRSLDGGPVADAQMQVWQADDHGFYDVQYPGLDTARARGVIHSRADGSFEFRSVLAEAYPIPHDGPVGKMLEALNRHPWRPAHLHFMITAPGFETLITHVFRNGDKYLESDTVFGVRSTLIADWIRHPDGIAPDGQHFSTPFYTLDYDFVLNPRVLNPHVFNPHTAAVP
jgi:hydroxyquinol 1,2-dioxygenase